MLRLHKAHGFVRVSGIAWLTLLSLMLHRSVPFARLAKAGGPLAVGMLCSPR